MDAVQQGDGRSAETVNRLKALLSVRSDMAVLEQRASRARATSATLALVHVAIVTRQSSTEHNSQQELTTGPYTSSS